MRIVSVTKARAELSRLIVLTRNGEQIVITRRGKPVAQLVGYDLKPRRKPGTMKGKIWMSPDFDKEDKEIEALFYDSPIEPPT